MTVSDGVKGRENMDPHILAMRPLSEWHFNVKRLTEFTHGEILLVKQKRWKQPRKTRHIQV